MPITRRQFQKLCLGAAASLPSISRANDRPQLITGSSSGDVSDSGAMLWTRSDRPAKLWIDISSDPSFASDKTGPKRYMGGTALAESDFNLKAWVGDLRPGTDWFYRLEAESLEHPGLFSNSLTGRFQTAETSGNSEKAIRFCWSGDTAGQGWGISSSHGGMKTYASMLSHDPQFLVHSGDQIYADGPIEESVSLDDGSIWKNLVTPGKSKVAELTQDFRENFYYNYLDQHMSLFHSQVATYHQWDDHEVLNNWYPGEILDDNRYSEKNVSLLAQRAKRAMFDCTPIKPNSSDPQRIYRVVNRGPLLDLFFLDLRSYRGPNSRNRQPQQSADTDFMGPTQITWLKAALQESKARWKIICSDMPIGVLINEWGTDIAENSANGDGPALGRELEFADLLSHIHRQQINNVQFITADVHYCASNHYRPERAQFKEFTEFWEHISGPIHAGTFAPGAMDNSFGPEQVFCGVASDTKANRPPSEPYQFFGKIDIDPHSQAMTVSHYNSENTRLWSKTFQAL